MDAIPWKPSHPGEYPTLGWYVLDWISENLAAPDRLEYEPFVPTREQAEFVLRFYELDPKAPNAKYNAHVVTGARLVRRGVLSRPRGWGKSPFVSSLALVEALGDVVFDGWDADGQPVGKPWAMVRTPLVQIAAASEAQTKNSWDALQEMLSPEAPVWDNYDGLEALGGFVNLPKGRIEPVTTSSTALKGKRPVFMLADQTEQWNPGNRASKVYSTIRNNVIKTGGSLLETPNAYVPGEDSVAEETAKAYFDMQSGANKKLTTGLLYDHREAPADTDLTDEKSLLAGVRYAYGDSSNHPDGCVIHEPPCEPGWAPVVDIMRSFWETDSNEQVSRSDWLNQITQASDAWLSAYELKAVLADPDLKPGDAVTLGFDGSRGRARGKPDATSLVACRVSDGHLFEVQTWEADQPRRDKDGKLTWDWWEPDLTAIEAKIAETFRTYNVVGFYCDPARDWRSYVNKWEAQYGAKVKVKARANHPFEWWMLGGRAKQVEQAIEQLEAAIRNADITVASHYTLTQHLLNARRRYAHQHLALGKENEHTIRKIDAAVAAVLAFAARLDAVAAGAGNQQRKYAPKRLY